MALLERREIKGMYKVAGRFTNGHPFSAVVNIADKDAFLARALAARSDGASLNIQSLSVSAVDVEVIDG